MRGRGVRFGSEVEKNILGNIENLRILKNFFNEADLSFIKSEKSKSERVVKNSNIVNLKYSKGGDLEKWIIDKLSSITGDVKRHGGSYVISSEPFHVHTDSGKNEEMKGGYFPYKNILIPLTDSTAEKPLYTVFFKQRSLFEASHFWRGKELDTGNVKPLYNNILNDYSELINYTNQKFDCSAHENDLSHLPYDMLHGLSVESRVYWNVGDMIIFDCSQLHASNNYKAFSGKKESLSLFLSKKCL
jgi:hypothetical protein